MADIDVQRRGTPVWIWWILGLLVLAALLFWLLTQPRQEVAIVEPATEPVPPAVAPDPVAEPVRPAALEQYMAECAPREPGEMGLEHQHTSGCIQQLVSAIDASIAEQRLAGVRPEMENARDAAQRLEESPPEAVNHAQMAREGLTSLASVFEGLQQQWHPDLAGPVQELRQNAEAISADELLLEQREGIQRFFERAGAVLTRMADDRA